MNSMCDVRVNSVLCFMALLASACGGQVDGSSNGFVGEGGSDAGGGGIADAGDDHIDDLPTNGPEGPSCSGMMRNALVNGPCICGKATSSRPSVTSVRNRTFGSRSR